MKRVYALLLALVTVMSFALDARATTVAPESRFKSNVRIPNQLILGGNFNSYGFAGPNLILRPANDTGTTLDTTITWTTPSAARTYTIPDAGSNLSFVIGSQSVPGKISRADTATETGVTIRAGILSIKNLAGTTITGSAGAGVFGLSTTATFGSPAQLSLVTESANNNTKTDWCEFEVVLPPDYVAGSAISVDIGQAITIGGGTLSVKSLTVDAFLVGADGTVGSNLGPVAQNMTTSTSVLHYAITPTGLVAGNKLLIQLQTVLTETASSGVTANIQSVGVTTSVKM